MEDIGLGNINDLLKIALMQSLVPVDIIAQGKSHD